MYLLIILFASLCYSVQKVLIYNYENSIFKTDNPKFWNPKVSIAEAKRIFGFRLDAIHIFQLLTIGLFLLAMAVGIDKLWLNFLPWWGHLVCSMTVFIFGEKSFYKHLIDTK